jgi:hypothetical protein
MYYVIDSLNQGVYVKMAKIKSCDNRGFSIRMSKNLFLISSFRILSSLTFRLEMPRTRSMWIERWWNTFNRLALESQRAHVCLGYGEYVHSNYVYVCFMVVFVVI